MGMGNGTPRPYCVQNDERLMAGSFPGSPRPVCAMRLADHGLQKLLLNHNMAGDQSPAFHKEGKDCCGRRLNPLR